MQRASHVLVIPNDTVSIYTRLWCVYEIFLASEWKKTCVIPAQPPWSALRHMVTWTLLPSVIGLALGCLWLIAVHFSPESMELHTRVLDNGLLLSLELALVTAIIESEMKLVDHWAETNEDLTVRLCAVYNCRWHLHFPRWSLLGHLGFCLLQMLMQVSSSACIVPWGVFPSGFSTVYDHILHYGIAFCVWSGGTVFCLARAHTELERKEMHRQASSNALDEERIRCAISGSEDNVLLAVNVLKSAGACNPLLQRAYTIGLDVRGSGIGHVFMRALAAAGIWELASSSIWEDCPNGQIWSIALAGGIPVCMLGTLLAARYWRPYGLREFKRLPVVVRLAHSPQITECPSYATWFGAVMLRPLLAFATLLLAWFGIYGRDEPEDLSCPHAKERDFSGVQPDLELDVDIVLGKSLVRLMTATCDAAPWPFSTLEKTSGVVSRWLRRIVSTSLRLADARTWNISYPPALESTWVDWAEHTLTEGIVQFQKQFLEPRGVYDWLIGQRCMVGADSVCFTDAICLLGNISLDPNTQRNDACNPSNNGSFGVALPVSIHPSK
eukprot:s789_g6.t1